MEAMGKHSRMRYPERYEELRPRCFHLLSLLMLMSFCKKRKKVAGVAKTARAIEVAELLEGDLAGLPEVYAE